MIAARITFYGACRDAVDFYSRVFHAAVEDESLFEDHQNQFPMGLSVGAGKLIFYVRLRIPDEEGDACIIMGDSPILALPGNMERSGCKDNIIFDMKLHSATETERIYNAFMEDGAKCNIPLCSREEYSKYGSFIDRFGICWNLYCMREE